jgi:hypothetical protein
VISGWSIMLKPKTDQSLMVNSMCWRYHDHVNIDMLAELDCWNKVGRSLMWWIWNHTEFSIFTIRFMIFSVVLPQLWPMLFKKKKWCSVRHKFVKITRIFEKLNPLKPKGLHFAPKIMGHLLSRYLISYVLWPSFVTIHSWSNFWTANCQFFWTKM